MDNSYEFDTIAETNEEYSPEQSQTGKKKFSKYGASSTTKNEKKPAYDLRK